MVHRRRRPECGDIILVSSPSGIYVNAFTYYNKSKKIEETYKSRRNNEYVNLNPKKIDYGNTNYVTNILRLSNVDGKEENQEMFLFIGNY